MGVKFNILIAINIIKVHVLTVDSLMMFNFKETREETASKNHCAII